MEREKGLTKVYEGSARVGRVAKNLVSVTLKPEDFSSPIAFQMAISRIYESMIKMIESGGPKQSYVAEIRFTDDLGNNVVFGVDLGDNIPPFSSDKVKARILVEIFEEED
ncbi:MAG: hypothetical protein P3X22_003755 [Thermoprotei archaeon]|nr:hypothetical protein [Thermoprotei archaeon]